MSKKAPFRYVMDMSRGCEAGQCNACPAVGDPFDDETVESRELWICSCSCHRLFEAIDGQGAR